MAKKHRKHQLNKTTIIDGYNLIFRLGWQPKAQNSMALEKSRNRMLAELADRIPAADRTAVTIVFDANTTPLAATAGELPTNGFQVLFANEFEDADSMIEELIRQHSAPKSLTVVSSDNRLQIAARKRKAIAIKSEDWIDQLDQRRPPASSNPESEITDFKASAIKDLESTDWLAEFDLADEPPKRPPKEKPASQDTYNPFPPGYGEDLLN